jgi:radical SAM superfamily enzyme YgiQ (UPF0313 family)
MSVTGAAANDVTDAVALGGRRKFEIILIKPSHYDDEGYVIQWKKSLIPANTLAALHALAEDAANRKILGPDVDINITPIDETNMRVRPDQLIRQIKAGGAGGFVGLVGVQSNQFPRALDIAKPLREAGITVIIGGFHVSGCFAMLPGVEPNIQRALDMGCTLYAGESEGRFDDVIISAANGTLKPLYNYLKDLPGVDGVPSPVLPLETTRRTLGASSSFDAGRGCPFQCSFCTIINVQGRKSRRRTPDDIEHVIRTNLSRGIDSFFITDDDFARNKDWEAILDRIIKIRGEPGNSEITFVIQVDTQCHRIPNFLEKAGRAHVITSFIGMENINPDNLMSAKKRQNKITDYRELLLDFKRNGILTIGGYILGFPNDTKESILRDIEIIKRELPIDILEFFFLTPLPGSEDHQKLSAAGVAMDPDLNKYDLSHVVTAHSKMSKEEWEEAYRLAWESYYTPEHCETIMRRAAAKGVHPNRLYGPLAYFYHSVVHEGVHPLEGGSIRRKYRRDRRPGMPIESPLVFYPRYWGWMISSNVRFALRLLRLVWQGRRITLHPRLFDYMDRSLTPVTDHDDEELGLLTQTEAARGAVSHIRNVQAVTAGARA